MDRKGIFPFFVTATQQTCKDSTLILQVAKPYLLVVGPWANYLKPLCLSRNKDNKGNLSHRFVFKSYYQEFTETTAQ
jgi:hypothetical protein